jgi:valyl-tRNA synthetase
MTAYKFIWDDFCSWYLEIIKPDYQQPIDSYTYNKTVELFEKLMQLIHPFMPFISEEIWHTLRERKEGEAINLTAYPKTGAMDEKLLTQAALSFELITAVREVRARAGKKNTETVDLFYNLNGNNISFADFENKILKLARLGKIEQVNADQPGTKTFIIQGAKFYVVTGEEESAGEEQKKLKEELEYTKGFLASVEKKLGNERFVSSAPAAVVESEKKKREDALKKIALLEQSLGL